MKSEIAPERGAVTAQFASTPLGARGARRLAAEQLAAWGWPSGSDACRDAVLLVAELAANAAQHGHLPGRDFRLRLAIQGTATLRVEVTDCQPERRPPGPCPRPPVAPPPAAESGRGMLLVNSLADRWGISDSGPVTKTVWCELDLAATGGGGGREA